MRIDKDLVAASATPLVLAILAEGESYGYAILKRINQLSGGEMDWTDGMLYPLLLRQCRPPGDGDRVVPAAPPLRRDAPLGGHVPEALEAVQQ
ncbi:MAG TPA: helix-turn-helix transcriptional regulator, partial [Egibacteraceae bacterium]|nr:helix-turn-helix transcriptional regulator [Egibacteraceae bacterium]